MLKKLNITKDEIVLLFGVFTISGVYGFIYETIFYYINDGILVHRGGAFGPFIQLYGWGGLIIYFICRNRNFKPWITALVSGLGSGILEFICGWFLWEVFGHIRAWNYNTEIWNWGNIGGYVCFRSVLVFALSGVLLMHAVLPLLIWAREKIGVKKFNTILMAISLICVADCIYNSILCRLFPIESANTFWEKRGLPASMYEQY